MPSGAGGSLFFFGKMALDGTKCESDILHVLGVYLFSEGHTRFARNLLIGEFRIEF